MKRLAYPILFLLGLLLPFLAYKINEDNQRQIYIQQHSPLLRLPVVYRVKGWGTLRNPNKIYVRYGPKDYSLKCSNRYFSNTLDSTSILVHYDSSNDRAVLARSSITRAYWLLIAVALVGFLIAGKAGIEMHKQLAEKRVT